MPFRCRRRHPLPATIACLLALTSVAQAGKPTVYTGAKIHTAAGQTFEPGTLVVQDGKIVDVGPADKLTVPDDAERIDLSGKVIIPGLVDSHSHLGVYSRPEVAANSDGNETTGPVQSAVRALDAINPLDPGIRMANAGGITTANIMPGSANVIGGQTLYVKLRGHTVEQMTMVSPNLSGGLKMANGENPKRVYGSRKQAPGTRMKVAALQRAEFLKARDYQRKWDFYRKKLAAGEDAAPPDIDLSLEPLVEAMAKKRTVHFHSHRADDILTVLRLADEFGFDLLLQHGTESYKVIDELARRKVPVSLTLPDSPGGKAEVIEMLESTAARLTKAGVKAHVNTDDPVTESRFLLRTAAITVRGGLDEQTALKTVTIYPAQALRIDDHVGSLEKGKDADFVVLSGEPFSVYSRVLQTFIDGQRVFNLDDPKERLYQTGGFALADRSQAPAARPLTEPQPKADAPKLPEDGKPANADAKEFVVFCGRLHTVAKEPVTGGAVHVRDGKVVYAGPREGFELPADVPVISAAAVTPGLIDAFSIVPLSGAYNIAADQDSDETSDPNQADVRALDAFHPSEPLLRYLLQQGVTVIHACPGRDNVIAGQSGLFRTHGTNAEQMAVRFPQMMIFNLGEIPKETYGDRKPNTRMGTASLVRAALSDAANYARKRKAAKDEASQPDRNLKHEALGQVLEQKLPAMFAAQRADDIVTALRLTDEFKLKSRLSLGAEAYLLTDRLAASKLPVIVHPTMQRVGGIETYNSSLSNAAVLADKGLLIAICSGAEGYVPKTRVARFEAAMAAVHGLGFDRALRAITLDAAKILEIDDRFGTLEPGKTADLVLYDGDPFEYATHVTAVALDGRLVYQRGDGPEAPLDLQSLFYSIGPEPACCLGW
ncbi:MAG TPA: amidohydrolase family protein [Pirellulales bacterium]|nr:amidohydrolase family protein [Pirellulales bacterium]